MLLCTIIKTISKISVQISYHSRTQRKGHLLRCPFCVGCKGGIFACALSGYEVDERGSLGLAPCRCRGQKQTGCELRSSRILHRVNRGEQNSVTARRDVFAQAKLTFPSPPKHLKGLIILFATRLITKQGV